MNRRMLSAAAGSVAIVVLLNGWAARHLEPSAWAAGEQLARLFAPPVATESSAEAVDWERIEQGANEAPPTIAGPLPSRNGEGRAVRRQGADHSEAGSLFVSRERVLQLSRNASVPASRYVRAHGRRPAGLQVAGVSGLGIGVRDGDVLTKVAGAEVRSSAAVISAVLKLRAKKAKAVTGEFWRGQERWQIVFEMPYLEAGAGSGATPTAAAVPDPGAPRSAAPRSEFAEVPASGTGLEVPR